MACKLQGAVVKFTWQGTRNVNSTYAAVTYEKPFSTNKVKVPELAITYLPSPTATSTGKFGRFGGKFVPETLVASLAHLEAHFRTAVGDNAFQAELADSLREYAGRETPLYHAKRLCEYYKSNNGGEGPEIYLKREDLNHTGSHKINNALPQVMLAKRMACRTVVTASASGQHGLATAAACAKLALDCIVFMSAKDIQRQYSNVRLIKLLGAQVEAVDGGFRDALSEAFRNWVGDLENKYLLSGSAVGPHPCPTMVRKFQSVVGKETRKQALEKWGGKPDILVASVGTGSNALGLFHEFIPDTDVRLIGVEAAGLGLDTGKHSSTLTTGEVGVYHGAITFLMQDHDGQILQTHSIAAGLEHPGVGPELSFLKESGRAEFCVATDQEALDAYQRLCKLEGIFPSLEAAHALAILDKLVPTLSNGTKVVVNCSGRGDKDAAIVFNRKLFDKE